MECREVLRRVAFVQKVIVDFLNVYRVELIQCVHSYRVSYVSVVESAIGVHGRRFDTAEFVCVHPDIKPAVERGCAGLV